MPNFALRAEAVRTIASLYFVLRMTHIYSFEAHQIPNETGSSGQVPGSQ